MIDKKGIITFLFLQSALYLIFMWMDISGQYSSLSAPIKFTGIVLCFFMTFLNYIKGNYSLDSKIMVLALFFTVCADICLLLTEHFILGVTFFCFVQSIYLFRITRYEGQSFLKHFFLRVGVFLTIVLICVLFYVPVNVLFVITVFYFFNILANAIYAMVSAYRSRSRHCMQWTLFAVGLCLFLFCDINVGIYNSASYIVINHMLYQMVYEFSKIGMWLFYLPSQVLIVLSSIGFEDKINNT
jgi:hypothetical protein